MFVANGIAVYYFTYVAGNAGLTATFILISNLLGVAASYLSKKAAGKFSARNTVIIAYLSMVVVLVLASFLQQYLGGPYHGEHCTVFLYHDQRLRTGTLRRLCNYSEYRQAQMPPV